MKACWILCGGMLLMICLFGLLQAGAEPTSITQGVITSNSLNLRAEPWEDSEWLGSYPKDTMLQIHGVDSGWYLVTTPDGLTGYMASNFIFGVAAQATPMPTQVPLQIGGVRQAGMAEVRTHQDEKLSLSIEYPLLPNVQANAALRRWINNTVYAAQVTGAERTEVRVGYDAYLVQDRFVGVMELGEQLTSNGQHELLAFAVNADLADGSMLTYEDIFGVGNAQAALALIQNALMEVGESDARMLMPDVLQYAALTEEGVRVFIPAVGSMPARTVAISYKTLAANNLLALDIWVEPDPTPTPLMMAADGPMIALTFDDGPASDTPRILDVLAQYNAKATFFVVGNRVHNFSDILARTAAEGHEIGIHTWSHENLTKISSGEGRDQIQKCINAIAKVTDTPVTTLRPPYGSVDGDVRALARDMGLKIALWSIDTEDWRTKDAWATYQEIMDEVQPGSIILCHDLQPSTADAMEWVIPELIAQGYRLVTVSELLSHSESGGAAGAVYTHLKVE